MLKGNMRQIACSTCKFPYVSRMHYHVPIFSFKSKILFISHDLASGCSQQMTGMFMIKHRMLMDLSLAVCEANEFFRNRSTRAVEIAFRAIPWLP